MSPRLARWMSGVAMTVAALAPATLPAQQGARTVEGRVMRPRGDGTVGLGGAWVVVHRVGNDSAGPLDSMRTAADGRYRLRYQATGDTSAVYFVSTSRGGVAYFTPPLRERIVSGGIADLLVHDTTSAPIPIHVLGRHVIVTAPDSARPGLRTFVEIYEIANDTTLTRVPGAEPTFSAPLPLGVAEVGGGDGDISSDAITLVGDRVHVTAPLAPGVKQFSFHYQLPVSGDPVRFRSEAPTPALEVLVEDPRGRVSGAGLVAVDPVTIDGRPLQRYLARDLTDTASFVVVAPGPDRSGLRMMLVVTAVGAALLLGLGIAFMRKGPAAFARSRPSTPEALALAIAELDARFERLASPTDAQKREHYVARAQLKGRLNAALARRDELG